MNVTVGTRNLGTKKDVEYVVQSNRWVIFDGM